MRYLTEKQIHEIATEAQAREIADEANALQARAHRAGLRLEIKNVADEFGVVLVRPQNTFQRALRQAVSA